MKKSAIWFQYEERHTNAYVGAMSLMSRLYWAPYTLSTEDEDAPTEQITHRIKTTLESRNLSLWTINFSTKRVLYIKEKHNGE